MKFKKKSMMAVLAFFFSNYSGRFSEGVALEISDKISEVFLQGFMAEFLKIFIKYFPNKSIVKF